MFDNNDLTQIKSHSLSVESVQIQIDYFKSGFPFLKIDRAATIGDGILKFESQQVDNLAKIYSAQSSEISSVKFVPASGAATRMFKELFEFVGENKKSPCIDKLLANTSKFAFADELFKSLGESTSEKDLVDHIINKGLGYGTQPKALILFHKYDNQVRTALEEHLVEGALYAKSNGGVVNIHFTVSPEHQAGFEKQVKESLAKYEATYGVKYAISYSQQKPQTDTIAVNTDNTPFRESDGSLLFRPAGHGALIENLNDIDADIIFIKTVDNVAPDRLKADTVKFKQVLAGVLLSTQKKCFDYLHKLNNNSVDSQVIDEISSFVRGELFHIMPSEFEKFSASEKQNALQKILNRPIRVCGMVKNEGEPGGGPFWAKNSDGSVSLQIAESSQIAPEQKQLMATATHFNPVDVVCGVRDYKGHKFDLKKYIDPQTGFISLKSKNGKELKAQELPGLWNGAMANWNTIFVEVPISTFSPVKTVVDLLRNEHQ